MSEFRLVLDVREWYYADIPMKDRYYILQERVGHHWRTCPVILWKDLSEAERKEITDALSP